MSLTTSALSATLSTRTAIAATTYDCALTNGPPTAITSIEYHTVSYGTALPSVVAQPLISASPPEDLCARSYLCSEIQAEQDITGIGVIVAFLVTAWTAFIFLAAAYWFGLLPDYLLRPVDRRMFRANSRNRQTQWKETLENITFIFSDQQLLTGVGVLIAGFYEASRNDLDTFHWSFVVYLAWLSSTVHLITLSLLRERLNEYPVLRNLRLMGMLTLLVLLLVALAPSTSIVFALLSSSASPQPYIAGAGTPVKCFFGTGYEPSWLRDAQSTRSSFAYGAVGGLNVNAVISYITLLLGYIWKLGQLFEGSLRLIRRYTRGVPEAMLEGAAKRAVVDREKMPFVCGLRYKFIKLVYVAFCMVTETFESFIATIGLLFFTLIWGSLQILIPRGLAMPGDVLQAENTFSYGQILPLLLLLQPIAAVVRHFAEHSHKSRKLEIFTSQSTPLLTNDEITTTETATPTYSTLTEALQHAELLSVDEKISNCHYDPIKAHLFRSRTFRALLWTFCFLLFVLGCAITSFAFVSAETGRPYWLGIFLAAHIGGMSVLTVVYLPMSRKLK